MVIGQFLNLIKSTVIVMLDGGADAKFAEKYIL